MKAKELRNKSVEELNNELESLLKTHFSLRLQKSMQQLAKLSEIKNTRRSIARIKTILHEKVLNHGK